MLIEDTEFEKRREVSTFIGPSASMLHWSSLMVKTVQWSKLCYR